MATKNDDKPWYIIAYVIPIVTGVIVLFLKGESDKRLKLHAMQSIMLGIFWVVVSIVFSVINAFIFLFSIFTSLLLLFIWLYGLYVGLEAYNGRDMVIPKITEYAKRYSGTDKTSTKAQK